MKIPNPVLLSGLSLLPMPSLAVCAKAVELGFDGVEILASGWNHSRWRKYKDYLDSDNHSVYMHLHAHEAWSAEESNSPSLIFGILEKLGFLPGSGTALDMLPDQRIPKIVYASELRATQDDTDLWIQTCPIMRNGKMYPSFRDFKREWLASEYKPSICFDFQHYLEWSTGTTMASGDFRNYRTDQLARMLIEGFELFSPHIREIHLTDSDPSLGRDGLNVMIGKGIIPLRQVCNHIRSTQWKGIIVPEVAPRPRRLFPYKDSDLTRILEMTWSLLG